MALTVFALGAPIGAWVGYNVAGAIADHYGVARRVLCGSGSRGVLAGDRGVAHGARAAARMPRQRRRR